MSADLRTIGGLRGALQGLDPAARVFIDNQPPTALSSYRGYYNNLAIERSGTDHERTELSGRGDPFELNLAGYGTYSPGHDEVLIKRDATVADLIQALDLAVGQEFEGYKGGQYLMSASSDLWVSEHGAWDHLRLAHIEVLPGRIDIATTEGEW